MTGEGGREAGWMGMGGHAQEMLDGHGGDGDEGGGVLHPFCVHLGTEDVDAAVAGRAEGFEAFVALLAWGELAGGCAIAVPSGAQCSRYRTLSPLC